MEVIDKLTEKYDIDTRIGICNMILDYIYIKEVDLESKISWFEIVKSCWYLSFGRYTNPEMYNVYRNAFDLVMELPEDQRYLDVEQLVVLYD